MEGTVAGIPVWLFGVGLAVIASIVSNLGYNLQKRCHLDNDKSEEERNKELERLRKVVKEERRGRRRQKKQQQQRRDAAALLAAGSSPCSITSGSASDSSPPTQLVIDVLAAEGAEAGEEEGGAEAEAEDASLPRSPTDLAIAELEAVKVNYTKQRVWQLGFFLTILGSFFDFAALAFAAQSIVAPLGSLTLVCNTILAPCMLGEEIRRQDIFATFAIILGSSIAVATASHQDDFIDTADLFELFTQGRFVGYVVVVCGVIAALRYAVFWARRIKKTQGRERYLQVVKYHRFCYAAAAGVMGAQSVLFAKCTAQLLANTITGKGIMFVHPWTYFVLLMLGLTIFFQVKWLNSGLRLFPSVVIVPTFQSFWILVSVLSGMAFFGEYKAFADAEWKGGLFGTGILLTIAGVYMLSQRSHVAAAPAEGGEDETAALAEGTAEDGCKEGKKSKARLLPSASIGSSSGSEDPSPTSSCASSVSATGAAASASASSSFSLADLLPPAPRRQTSREKRSNTLSGYTALGSDDEGEGGGDDLEEGGGGAGPRRKKRSHRHHHKRRGHGRPRALSAGGMGDSVHRRLRRRHEQQRLAAAGPPGVDTFAQSLYALFLQATTGRLPAGSGGGAVGAAAAADEFFSPPVSPHHGGAGDGSVLPRYTPPSLAAAGVSSSRSGSGRSGSVSGTAAAAVAAALPRQHQQPPGVRGSSIQ